MPSQPTAQTTLATSRSQAHESSCISQPRLLSGEVLVRHPLRQPGEDLARKRWDGSCPEPVSVVPRRIRGGQTPGWPPMAWVLPRGAGEPRPRSVFISQYTQDFWKNVAHGDYGAFRTRRLLQLSTLRLCSQTCSVAIKKETQTQTDSACPRTQVASRPSQDSTGINRSPSFSTAKANALKPTWRQDSIAQQNSLADSWLPIPQDSRHVTGSWRTANSRIYCLRS